MAHYNQRQPRRVSSFIGEKAEAAVNAVKALTKAYIGRNADEIAKPIIAKNQIARLELGKHKTTIPENSPKDVRVSWPFTGESSLIGLIDTSGNNLKGVSGNSIDEAWTYPASVSENAHNREDAANKIQRLTLSFQTHFNRINTEVDEHNKTLVDNIPRLVEERLEYLAKLKAAEDSLN